MTRSARQFGQNLNALGTRKACTSSTGRTLVKGYFENLGKPYGKTFQAHKNIAEKLQRATSTAIEDEMSTHTLKKKFSTFHSFIGPHLQQYLES